MEEIKVIIYAIYAVFTILVTVLILYTIYKFIWYAIKMISFRVKLKRLNRNNINISFKRNFFAMIFGKKGDVDFILSSPTEKCEVCIISFISIHGRWNFQKERSGDYVEAFRNNKIFYKVNVHSESNNCGIDNANESKFQRCRLNLTPINQNYSRQILLIYPKPKLLTKTNFKLEYLNSGDLVENHEVIIGNEFFREFKVKKTT